MNTIHPRLTSLLGTNALLRLTASLALPLLLFSGCAASREVPFNEADFARTSGSGSGVVTGHAFGVLNSNKTLSVDRDIVVVTPVNAYTTENIRRRFINGENLRSADNRIDKYLRSTTTDAQGNFTIRGMPPGEYYVESEVDWTTTYEAIDNDGVESTMFSDHKKLIFARISMKDRQTVHVTSWDQSNPAHNGFYAYGGTLSHPHHTLVTCQ